ncbi:cAMP-independent regulatory protein pac2 [Nosema granulosis]|uniref:cAMP-independent regulatory protein pac2 n=1 Tax=Nosema granulosis TaxID=83296 RepID=A0A9P6GWG3_9MICR|nr:cAMP-independent regulatory protein pac2 [Nosema granulosis]
MNINSISSGVGCAHTEIECGLILEQAVIGRLRRIRRRMNERERRCIKSGDIFVYSEEESKIKRWTDSRKWSPSRVHGSFMMYFEVREHNPMIKKTYSAIYKGFKYHIVFYSLLADDRSRACCQKYRNTFHSAERPSSKPFNQPRAYMFPQDTCVQKNNPYYQDQFFRRIDEDDYIHKHSRDFY